MMNQHSFVPITPSFSVVALFLISSTITITSTRAFAPSVFSAPPSVTQLKQQSNPFHMEGVHIDPPDFDAIFSRIQEVSPLAQSVIEGRNGGRGLDAVSGDKNGEALNWKTVESNKKGTVREIQRVDNYNGVSGAPMLRFRASMTGPCLGEFFGRYIMDLTERKKWDAQIHDVKDIHQIDNLDAANAAMGMGQYGECSRLGIGYGQTKAALGITPREQMFTYGLQNFKDGSSLIWGTEMDPKHDALLPPGPRHTRAKSHLFAATLTPTGAQSFDIEYVLQLEIGGGIPQFLTTPVMIKTVKTLFDVAAVDFAAFADVGGKIRAFLEEKFAEEDERFVGLLVPV